MQERPSRRSVLAGSGALALAGLAGCTSGDTDDATTPLESTDTTANEPTDTTTSEPTNTADATTTTEHGDPPSVDWSEVAEFRTWITDYSTISGSNHRFDYQAAGLDRVVGSGRTAFLDLSPEAVDGALFQSANVVFVGEFDAAALTTTIEASADHEVTGEYEGYTTAAAAETGTEFAVGGDAVLAGSELSAWIDAHLGHRERLEEVDPLFTRIIERLPDREFVTAQYGPPLGGEIDADSIDAWGTSMPSVQAESATWVYALEPDTPESVVDELETELGASALTGEVTERTVDGRFVTFTATLELPERGG